jgi:hypothetical protein
MPRFFVTFPLLGRVRGGVSVGSWELAAARRKGRRRLAEASGRPASDLMIRGPNVRPARSFYGVALDQPDPSAELPREHHPWRDAWTIASTLVWLLVHAILWLGFFAIVGAAALVVFMSHL